MSWRSWSRVRDSVVVIPGHLTNDTTGGVADPLSSERSAGIARPISPPAEPLHNSRTRAGGDRLHAAIGLPLGPTAGGPGRMCPVGFTVATT